jgi:hypothetical protein
VDCSTPTQWVYRAHTIGWTDSTNLVNAWETGNAMGWNDEHELPSVAFGANNTWDELERQLADQASLGTFAPDSNTLFTCGIHDVDPVMTFAIRVYDFDANYSDCAIFSSDVFGINEVFSGGAPTYNPVTDAAEVNPTDCIVWNVPM